MCFSWYFVMWLQLFLLPIFLHAKIQTVDDVRHRRRLQIGICVSSLAPTRRVFEVLTRSFAYEGEFVERAESCETSAPRKQATPEWTHSAFFTPSANPATSPANHRRLSLVSSLFTFDVTAPRVSFRLFSTCCSFHGVWLAGVMPDKPNLTNSVCFWTGHSWAPSVWGSVCLWHTHTHTQNHNFSANRRYLGNESSLATNSRVCWHA